MGVVGLGCDLLHVPRMEAALGRWGPRLLRKVLHADELSIFHLRSRPAQPAVLYLASRWAAKEAAFKAFGRGRGEVLFTEMKVANEPTGRPILVLEGKTRKLAGELGITRTHLAISHEHSYALAHVIFERD